MPQPHTWLPSVEASVKWYPLCSVELALGIHNEDTYLKGAATPGAAMAAKTRDAIDWADIAYVP